MAYEVSQEAAEILLLVGRILYGGTLLMMAMNHFMKFQDMAGYAKMKGVPAAGAGVIGSGMLLALGALSILLGFQPAIGAILVVVFLVPVAFTMHNFWAVDDPQMKMTEMSQFLKNTVMAGAALMFLSIPQPWAFSI